MDVFFRAFGTMPSFAASHSVATKNTGMRKMPIAVAKNMPPTTATPMPLRAAAPAPVAIASGLFVATVLTLLVLPTMYAAVYHVRR